MRTKGMLWWDSHAPRFLVLRLRVMAMGEALLRLLAAPTAWNGLFPVNYSATYGSVRASP